MKTAYAEQSLSVSKESWENTKKTGFPQTLEFRVKARYLKEPGDLQLAISAYTQDFQQGMKFGC